MIRAYDESYLRRAQMSLGNSLDYAVNTLCIPLEEYYTVFVQSEVAARFENGDPFIILGHSGIELALLVWERYTGLDGYIEKHPSRGKTREYWVGWALAYYQWYTTYPFSDIEQKTPVKKVSEMYDKYHEMEITHFVDRLNELRMRGRAATYLKELRQAIGYSQSELSKATDIPLKTLQHYEQGTKSLAKANATYVIRLARALRCKPEQLL